MVKVDNRGKVRIAYTVVLTLIFIVPLIICFDMFLSNRKILNSAIDRSQVVSRVSGL